MQDLYDKYVRLGYYERRHPVRFGLVAAIAMAAVISLPVAVYLGLYWPPVRDWKSALSRVSARRS